MSEIEFYLFHSSLVCTRCQETLLSRRDCARCKKHFCYPCTDHHVKLLSKAQDQLFYVCDGCHSQLLLVQELHQNEMLVWGKTSPRGKQWLLSSNCPTDIHLPEFLVLPVQPQDSDMISKDILSGRTAPNTFSWEIHELLCRMEVADFERTVADVLRGFCARRPDLGYCQGMNMVTVWLLMFLEQDSAFQMICHLVETILPAGFYADAKANSGLNSFFLESTVIAAIADHKIPALQRCDMPIHDFVDIFTIKLLIQLFVNAVDVRSTIFLWDHLMEEGPISLTRGTLSLLVLCEKAIGSGDHPAKILQQFEENRIIPQLQIVYGEVSTYVTPKRVARLRSHSKTIRAKQWRESKPIILRRLEQSSNFTLSEIKKLQEEFNLVLRTRFEAKRSSGWKRLKRLSAHTFAGIEKDVLDRMASFNEDLEPGFSRDEFISMIRAYRPFLLEMADRLFDLFDEDQSASLDFRELIKFLSIVLKGSFEEKLRLIFRLFAVKEGDFLSAPEFTHLMSKVMKMYRLGLDFDGVPADKIVEHVDLQILSVLKGEWSSQKANWDMFNSFVVKDEIMMSCFVQYFEHVFAQDVASPSTMIQTVGSHVESHVSPYKEEDYSPILPDETLDDPRATCSLS